MYLSSCIEQASKSENVSHLAKVLAEYGSESRSAEETDVMTSPVCPVSREARQVFLFSGSSVEADVYRKLVVERINDNDITTALKLCCIAHQIPLICRVDIKSNSPISDAQILMKCRLNKR